MKKPIKKGRKIVFSKKKSRRVVKKVIKHSKSVGKKPKVIKKIVKKHDSKKINTPKATKQKKDKNLLKKYEIVSGGIPFNISIHHEEGEFVPIYEAQLSTIGKTTGMILEKIREELIDRVNLGIIDITDSKRTDVVQEKFTEATKILVKKYFPSLNSKSSEFLTSYLVKKSLGMGEVELLMSDPDLEEVAINSAAEPVWVYHKEFSWLKTNIVLETEAQIQRYASMIGRRVNRQITVLEPLMDATLTTGDRVNATLNPISSTGNTITIRKFASKPWTIADFVRTGSISASAAAFLWECIHYEMSIIIAGGTASGKTSMLNVVSNFFPPNQRIISIEDTREIRLPKFLHWVPMVTRLPNNEGKGGISMLDLLVNSLRMRPDRIIFGEIRRKKEAEVLFESIHTGHSVYATIHANNTKETVTRLTNPPIDVPKSMLPAVSLILVQYRNRRSGLRRTFELAEIKETGDPNILNRYNPSTDSLNKIANSVAVKRNLELYTGLSSATIKKELNEKETVLKWLAKQKNNTVDSVGKAMAEYYTNRENFMKLVRSNKPMG